MNALSLRRSAIDSGVLTMKSVRSVLAMSVAILALVGCGSLKEDLGLGRNPPDEFAVADRPPLSLPPDFTLRPPVPGAPRPQDVDLTQHASDTLFNKAGNVEDRALSGVEKSLLAEAGVDKAAPDIRMTITREAAEKVAVSDHLVQELLWWKRDVSPAVTVDAGGESARIKAAKDKGERLNTTPTPTIERDKGGWLGL